MQSATRVVEPNIHRFLNANGFLVSVTVKGQRKSAKADTLEDARALRDSLRQSLEQASALPQKRRSRRCDGGQVKEDSSSSSSSWSLYHAVERTITLHWTQTSGSEGAIRNARQAVNFFGPRTPLDSITMEHIDQYIQHLENIGNSGGTINRKLSALSKVLRTAHERGKLGKMLRMPRRKEAIHRIRFLTGLEEEKLLRTLTILGYQEQAEAVQILLYTGFRCSELWRLECRDINLDRRVITVWKTKNGRPRTIPIVQNILPLVTRRYCDAGGSGRLFPLASNAWLRNAWFRARTLMGMDDDPQFVPHMLRHTCATRLSQGGVSMPVIKEWMGHTSIITTSRYTHFAPSDLQEAAAVLGVK